MNNDEVAWHIFQDVDEFRAWYSHQVTEKRAELFRLGLSYWPGGYRLHWRIPGLYALYPNGGIWPLSWTQVLRRVRAGCTVHLMWLDAPDDLPLALRAVITVEDMAALAQVFAAWNVLHWRLMRRKAVAA